MTLRNAALTLGFATLTATAGAWEEGELLIWAPPGSDTTALERLASAHADQNDLAVTVETPQRGLRRFQQGDEAGPDLFIGRHDPLSDWAETGRIAPVELPDSVRSTLAADYTAALSHEGQLHAYPLGVSGPLQLCNADLVDSPFDTWQSVWQRASELGREALAPLWFEHGNLYYSYGLLTAQGAYVFGRSEDGAYNPADIGLNQPGAVAALSYLRSMIEEGLLPESMDAERLDRAFREEAVACVITDASAMAAYRETGLDLLAGPYPSLNGEPGRGFSRVTGLFVNAASPNLELARGFAESRLLTAAGFDALADVIAPAAPLHGEVLAERREQDAVLDAAYPVWRAAEPVPAAVAMTRVWIHGGQALSTILSGRGDIQATLDQAVAALLLE